MPTLVTSSPDSRLLPEEADDQNGDSVIFRLGTRQILARYLLCGTKEEGGAGGGDRLSTDNNATPRGA